MLQYASFKMVLHAIDMYKYIFGNLILASQRRHPASPLWLTDVQIVFPLLLPFQMYMAVRYFLLSTVGFVWLRQAGVPGNEIEMPNNNALCFI